MAFYTLRRNTKNVKIDVDIYTYISQKELKNMRRETLQEKSFHDMLPPHFAAIAQVSFSYQDMLRIAQDHLKTFYGDRADWKKCIENYFHSAEYQDNCHYVSTCEDIPIVTTGQLHRMIQEDEQYQAKVKEFLNFQQAIEADRLNDPLFDKFRFEHDEEFCKWIFEEMDCGNKVYPHDDIPQITEYMEKIKNSHQFSQKMFDHIVLERWHFSEQQARAVRQELQQHGYTIVSGQKGTVSK